MTECCPSSWVGFVLSPDQGLGTGGLPRFLPTLRRALPSPAWACWLLNTGSFIGKIRGSQQLGFLNNIVHIVIEILEAAVQETWVGFEFAVPGSTFDPVFLCLSW